MNNDYQKRVDAFNAELTPFLEALRKKYNLILQPQNQPQIGLLDVTPKEPNVKEETKSNAIPKTEERSEGDTKEPTKK